MSLFRLWPLAAVVLLSAPTVDAADAPSDAFASHRAVYEMSLADRTDRSEIGAVSGRLVYEFSGSACEGWSSRFRMVTRLDPVEGPSRLTDLRTTSFESGDGKTFDFVNENWVDRVKVEESKGRAVRENGAVSVKLERPSGRTVSLAAALRFPTEHLRDIVAAAEAGKSLVEIDLYDGSDDGAKTYRTTVVIGRETTGADDIADEPAAANDLLKGHRSWPVELSFFDLAKQSEAVQLPEYRLSFVLYDDGVSRRMRFDYGSFALKGTLTSLESLPASPCP